MSGFTVRQWLDSQGVDKLRSEYELTHGTDSNLTVKALCNKCRKELTLHLVDDGGYPYCKVIR